MIRTVQPWQLSKLTWSPDHAFEWYLWYTTITFTSHSFSLLCNTPAKEQTLVTGDSFMRHVNLKTPATMANCVPGSRAGDSEWILKMLAKDKRKFSKIRIHLGAVMAPNYVNWRSLILILSRCVTLPFSGPLPNWTGCDISAPKPTKNKLTKNYLNTEKKNIFKNHKERTIWYYQKLHHE